MAKGLGETAKNQGGLDGTRVEEAVEARKSREKRVSMIE